MGAEIDEQIARAKDEELEQVSDLEWYDYIQGEEEPTTTDEDPR
jgi:hypothetical protein